MLERSIRLGLVAVVAACLARPAAAQSAGAEATIRESRRVSFGLSPAWPWMAEHDYTAPVPALRFGVNLSPHLALDLTGGMMGLFNMVDIGARWFFAEGNGSPYLMGRVGRYHVDADDGPASTYGYATLGAGVEYAGDSGFAGWAEAGPAVIGGNYGAYVSAGLGFRFRSAP